MTATVTIRDGVPALNVKDETLYAHTEPYAELLAAIPDNVTETLYVYAQEDFWTDAHNVALDYGYGGAYAEGRSAGWLVVADPPDLAGERVDTYSPKDLRADAARWLDFAGEIERLMDYHRGQFLEQLQDEHAAREVVRGAGRGTQ